MSIETIAKKTEKLLLSGRDFICRLSKKTADEAEENAHCSSG